MNIANAPILTIVTFLPIAGAIFLASMGFNLLGDGLRDVLDPRSAD